MLDLSGTVHVDDRLLPGVKDALDLLASRSVPVQFVTNNSKESQESLVARLEATGLKVSSKSVFSSLTAAHALGMSHKNAPTILDNSINQPSEINVNFMFETFYKQQKSCVCTWITPRKPPSSRGGEVGEGGKA